MLFKQSPCHGKLEVLVRSINLRTNYFPLNEDFSYNCHSIYNITNIEGYKVVDSAVFPGFRIWDKIRLKIFRSRQNILLNLAIVFTLCSRE